MLKRTLLVTVFAAVALAAGGYTPDAILKSAGVTRSTPSATGALFEFIAKDGTVVDGALEFTLHQARAYQVSADVRGYAFPVRGDWVELIEQSARYCLGVTKSSTLTAYRTWMFAAFGTLQKRGQGTLTKTFGTLEVRVGLEFYADNTQFGRITVRVPQSSVARLKDYCTLE
jgi:hypothetical protein